MVKGSNRWMFQTVKCRAYMKKVNDGKCIIKLEPRETEDGLEHYMYSDSNRKHVSGTGAWTKEVEDCDGSLDFLKNYYECVEKEFAGIVVGMKMVVVSAYLYVDTAYDQYHEWTYVGKEIHEQRKCALVYYGCNRSRLVPMDFMEVIEEFPKGLMRKE